MGNKKEKNKKTLMLVADNRDSRDAAGNLCVLVNMYLREEREDGEDEVDFCGQFYAYGKVVFEDYIIEGEDEWLTDNQIVEEFYEQLKTGMEVPDYDDIIVS
jgi:hypothetical protein